MYFGGCGGGACNLNEVFGQCQTNYHEQRQTTCYIHHPLTHTKTISIIIPIYLLEFNFKIDFEFDLPNGFDLSIVGKGSTLFSVLLKR